MQKQMTYIVFAIFALTLTVLSIDTYAQVVHFPDPNLRAAVAEKIGVDPDRITQAALQRLARLGVLDREIENLEGLQYASNLRLLNLASNRISDLTPLANLHSLEELELDKNVIKDVSPLAGLTNLLVLTLRRNLITDIEPLRDLTRLQVLIIEHNSITDISPLGRLTNLRVLKIPYNGISDLTPLANLTNLEELLLNENRISDVEPLRGLTRLQVLTLEHNSISDITPLANLLGLKHLRVSWNVIEDISPLAGLTNLRVLAINHNMITDVGALSGLIELREIAMQHNFADHSPLDSLSLDVFIYDQICDMSPEPLDPRLANRSFPSIFASFTPKILNKQEEIAQAENPRIAEVGRHDAIVSGTLFWDEFRFIDGEWRLVFTDVEGDPSQSALRDYTDDAVAWRDQHLAFNPNLIFLLEVRIHSAWPDDPSTAFPADHPYWLRDASGQIVTGGRVGLINFVHPDVQDIIVGQALAVAKCGLYDGIFFDHWHDFSSAVDNALISDEDAQRARENIVRRIREGAHDDFLISGNTNDRIIPITGPFMNAGFMESIVPAPGVPREPSIRRVRESLEWLENNLREPRLVMLQGGTDPSEPPDSPYNQRLMRATTTMSLTHSDGYTQFAIDSGNDKYWYDFWDVDLGQPVGPKFQFYENTEGLYIREFDNGWAVYNQSGEAQVVTLPEEVQSVASGLVSAEHAVLNIDGDIFLKVKMANPADVNGDGTVNILDLTLVAQALGTADLKGDVNGDGVINVFDLVFVANQF